MKKKLILLITVFFLNINFVFAKETVKFSNCVDGDTIKILIDNEEYTVRMLAIDTPESVHPTKKVEYYGKEASDYTCNKIKNATKIELEYDDNSAKTDKYGRLLAWIFIDGQLLQKDLVANGYAKIAYLYGDYKYTSELETVQEIASLKEIGIWNEVAKELYNNNQSTQESSSNTTIDDKSSDTTNIDNETSNLKSNTSQTITSTSNNYSTNDIIIIIILLIIIFFVGDKAIKKKATKKLKKYLK